MWRSCFIGEASRSFTLAKSTVPIRSSISFDQRKILDPSVTQAIFQCDFQLIPHPITKCRGLPIWTEVIFHCDIQLRPHPIFKYRGPKSSFRYDFRLCPHPISNSFPIQALHPEPLTFPPPPIQNHIEYKVIRMFFKRVHSFAVYHVDIFARTPVLPTIMLTDLLLLKTFLQQWQP